MRRSSSGTALVLAWVLIIITGVGSIFAPSVWTAPWQMTFTLCLLLLICTWLICRAIEER